MSLTKTLAAAAAVSLLFGLSAAEAAKPKPKKPVCNLLKDAKGDATGTGTAATAPNEPALDILSADVATNATTLTGVFRMAAIDASNTTAATGRGFQMSFVVKGKLVSIRSFLSPAGEKWADGNGTGKIDTAKKEIRFSVPISKLSMKFKANDKLTQLSANVSRYAGNNFSLGLADRVDSASTYVAAWPSCVKVGA